MNIISITPEQAWQMTLDQLRLEMPKADFDTWVGSAHFVAFGDGILTVGIPNAYGRDWSASRLTSTVNRLLTGILDQPVEVQFTVMEEVSKVQREAILNEEAPVPEQHPKVLSLQAEYQSIYDEIVHPDQVIVVPGYFLRYIPCLVRSWPGCMSAFARQPMKQVFLENLKRSLSLHPRRWRATPG